MYMLYIQAEKQHVRINAQPKDDLRNPIEKKRITQDTFVCGLGAVQNVE